VQLPYAGSTPEEVERTILRPVEETLSTMTDVKSMEGNATSEQGSVFLMFSDWDRDIEIAAAEARERIDAIRDDLPDDLQRYFVWKWSTSDEPALELRLTSKTLDLTKEYDRIDRVYKRRLERIPAWRRSKWKARRRTKSRSRSTRTASTRTAWRSTSSTSACAR
jgi:HAE1 family hydrophobic/amphiphilic exporter-1